MAQDEKTARLVLSVPILERMRRIEGWLEDDEADLLISAAAHALTTLPRGSAIVEVGSYCGRATVVLAGVAERLNADTKVYAIDPHDGVVGAYDQGVVKHSPTKQKFLRNIEAAGLTGFVEPIVKRSYEVVWDQPLGLLFIDGLHDYPNVARDFFHFERWLIEGGLVAFHDYADYYPGVKAFVRELLATGCYEIVERVRTLMLLRRLFGEHDHASRSTSARSDEQSEPAHLMTQQGPLASCIMPTANRRFFVPQAIQYFLRQDYPHRELIIVDDGADPVADLIPSDTRIRYVRLENRRTMGAKHNLACELARGEIIVHWDDDDWMAENRLSYQVGELLSEAPETLAGLSRLFFYDPAACRAWEYAYPPTEHPWVCGNTFCYRRTFWQRRPFPNMNEGADTAFVQGLKGATILAHQDPAFFVAIMHAGNTSPKRTTSAFWHQIPADRIKRIIGADIGFYRTI